MDKQADHKLYLSPAEFSAASGLSPATIARYLASGLLPKFQPGGKRHRVLIPRAALDAISAPSPDPPKNTPSLPTDGPSVRPVRSGRRPKWLGTSPTRNQTN